MLLYSSITLLSLFTSTLASALPQGANTWKTLQSIPIAPRQEHSVVSISEKTLAILGGVVPNKDAIGGAETTGIVQFFNTRTNQWRRFATEAPVKTNHPNVAAVNGKMYLLGGLSDIDNGAWRAFPNSWVYNLDLDEWTELEPLPESEARGSAAVGVHGNVIYMAGGMSILELKPNGTQGTVDVVSAFDTKTSKWLDLPEAAKRLPEGRDHAGVSIVKNKLYVLGGRTHGQHNVKDTVFILDLDNLEAGWATSEAKMPTPRGGVLSATVGSKVYIMGGEGNPVSGSKGVYDQVEVFDTETETWEELGTMKVPRHGGAAVAVKGGIYIPGGGVAEGGAPVDTVDVYWP
jgi:N-acetylneuraminic acid mutarotase